MFGRKKPLPPIVDDRIKVRIIMGDGRNVVRKVSPREYETAHYDLYQRHGRNENSLIYIGDIIAHPDEFKKIEKV